MYVWEGTDKQGKRVKGEQSGQSDALVKSVLRRQGITPLKVKKKPKPLLGGAGKAKITPKDITVFSRQLATMMSQKNIVDGLLQEISNDTVMELGLFLRRHRSSRVP